MGVSVCLAGASVYPVHMYHQRNETAERERGDSIMLIPTSRQGENPYALFVLRFPLVHFALELSKVTNRII